MALDFSTVRISARSPAEFAHGWMFSGFCLNLILLGVMVTQVYLYYTNYKRDKVWIKAFVLGLFVADIANTLFMFVYLYQSLIVYYGQPEHLAVADWLFATEPATTGLISSSVQLFFAWRVRMLTKSWPSVIFISALSIAGAVACILTAWNVGQTPHFADFRNFKPTVIIWLAAEAVADVVITRKRKTGFRRSDLIVDRIIKVTMQTGMITMLVATVNLILYLVDPRGTDLLFNFPLAKLYSNSLMSSLNSRAGSFSQAGSYQMDSENLVMTTGGITKSHGGTSPTSMKPQPDIVTFVGGRHPETKEEMSWGI